MENEENKTTEFSQGMKDTDWKRTAFDRRYPRNNWLPGLIVLLIGIVVLFKRIPQTENIFPDWLFDWPMILIAIGLIGGARHGFRYHFGWLFPLGFGIYFLLKDQNIILDKWDMYIVPIVLIVAGLLLIVKRSRFGAWQQERREMHMYHKVKRKQQHWQQRHGGFSDSHASVKDDSDENLIDINTIFGKAEKSMFSKTFRGGNISCSFGGAELNLTQADMEETAVLNISVTFGGLEIAVPANWTVQNELTVFMGGIEDKRRTAGQTVPPKILILKGNVFCGGVELKN